MWTRLVACCARLGSLWARRRLDEETRREFETHLGLLAARYVRSGPDAGGGTRGGTTAVRQRDAGTARRFTR